MIGLMSQPDLFGSTLQPLPQPDPEAVRRRMRDLLSTLRVADTLPLTEKQLRFWQTVVPQMTNWLPAEEKAAICAEFDGHVARLTRKAA